MSAARTCAAMRCHAPVQPGMLMCKAHWFTLPARLRGAIWRTWRARHMAAYQDNVRVAVDYIDNLEGPFEARRPMRDASAPVAFDGDEPVAFGQGRML